MYLRIVVSYCGGADSRHSNLRLAILTPSGVRGALDQKGVRHACTLSEIETKDIATVLRSECQRSIQAQRLISIPPCYASSRIKSRL